MLNKVVRKQALSSTVLITVWRLELSHVIAVMSLLSSYSYPNPKHVTYFVFHNQKIKYCQCCDYSRGLAQGGGRKYFPVFSKSAPTATPRYTILDSRFLTVMRSRKAGLPSATRARKQELDSDRKFSKSKFFKVFLKTTFFSTIQATLFIISRKYFFGFSKSAPTLDTQFWTRGFPR